MATKKSTTKTKKVAAKPAKATPTRVTTVKAVEAGSPKKSTRTSSAGVLGHPITSASIAEFIGTFLLASTILVVQNSPLYLFFIFVGLVMLIGGISGAHMNPAITLGAWATRRINWVRAASYIVAQVLAAMLALVVMNAFLSQYTPAAQSDTGFDQGAPSLYNISELPKDKESVVFFAEMIGVMVLGFAYATILQPGIKKKLSGALTIGGTSFVAMAFATTVASYVSGSVVLNPAVGITLKAMSFNNLWTIGVYAGAAVLGAVIGFFLYDLIKVEEAKQ